MTTKIIKSDKIPHDWRQVTFRQYIEICRNSEDYIRILSVFLEIDPEIIRKSKIENFEVVLSRLNFLKVPPEWEESPTHLNGIRLPKDITFESTEQFENMRKLLQEGGEDPIKMMENFGKMAAIYYQPARDQGEYDYERALELISEIEKFSCVEVVSIGRFFWLKLIGSLNNIPLSSLNQATRQKKKKRGLRSLIKRLSSMVHFRSYRETT